MADPASPVPAPPLARLHIWQIQSVRDLLLIFAVIGLIYAGYAMRAVTVPLLVALLLAYLFEPVIARLTQRMSISRPMAVGGLLLTLGLVVVISLAVVIPALIGQTMRFADDLRTGRFRSKLERLEQFVPEKYQSDFQGLLGWMDADAASVHLAEPGAASQPDDAPPQQPAFAWSADEQTIRQIAREEIASHGVTGSSAAPTSVLSIVRSSAQVAFDFLGAVIGLGLLAFLIPFYFFFFSVSYPKFVDSCRDLLPVSNRARMLDLVGKMDRAVAGFVRGRIVICLLMGVMLAAGWLMCGVPYAIVLGLLVGTFSIVPYLGGVGIPLAVGLLAIEQLSGPAEGRMAWWGIILWPSVVFAIVQVIETYFLTPVIAGKATNLGPVTILVAVLAGGTVGGVYGMILAIPVAACLKILLADVVVPKVRAWTRGEARDPLPIS